MSGLPLPVLLGAMAVGAGVALALGAVLLGRPALPSVDRRLATYFGQVSARQEHVGARGRAVLVAQAVVPGGTAARLSRRLAGAGMTVQPAEWVLLHAGIAVGSAALGLSVGPGLALVFLVLGAIGPVVYLHVRHARRLTAFSGQLPDTLTMISNSLAAGLSVPQAIDTVVREGQEPIAGELRRALIEQRLGVDMSDALDGIAARMGSVDFGWVVMAIRIQREVGGNLGEVLDTVAETLREREYLRRQVRTLSAEGRMSAYILGGLPVALFVYLLVANRDFVAPMYSTAAGLVMLLGATLLVSVGGFVMSRMVKVVI